MGLTWILILCGACAQAVRRYSGAEMTAETWDRALVSDREWVRQIGYGDGSGDGDGGDGSGSGDGDGGDGDGSGYGDAGSGDGSGYGDGNGCGYGYGYKDGDGDGHGYGYKDGDGFGSGHGYGSGYGDGSDLIYLVFADGKRIEGANLRSYAANLLLSKLAEIETA